MTKQRARLRPGATSDARNGRKRMSAARQPNTGSDNWDIDSPKASLHAKQRSLLELRRDTTTDTEQTSPAHEREFALLRAAAERAKAQTARAKQPAPPIPATVIPLVPEDQQARREKELAARIAALEWEVARARTQQNPPRWQTARFWLQMLALSMMLGLIVKFIASPTGRATWWSDDAPSQSSGTPKAAAPPTISPVQPEPPPESASPQPAEADLAASVEESIRQAAPRPTTANQPFDNSLQRLLDAVESYPSRSFHDLVTEVNRNHPASAPVPCAFEWNALGKLALKADLEKSDGHSLSSDLNRCAESIENLSPKVPTAPPAPK